MSMFNAGWVGQWQVVPPPGLTDTGLVHRFQNRTVARLRLLASDLADKTLSELKNVVEQTYQEGEGITAGSLAWRPINTGTDESGRTGFGIEFVGGGRALVFLTALAGLPYPSPGHYIPQNGVSRFYWRNPLHGLPPGTYTFFPQKPAFWQPRQRRGDVIARTLGAGAQQFAQAMIAENNRAVVELVQNDLRNTSKSLRVNVAAGSGIAPL